MGQLIALPTPSGDSSPTLPPLGKLRPRLWTQPLRRLSPESSYGYRVIAFARDVLGEPLDPWQQWLVIHAGELLPDGRPRFRQLLVIVARQNGKTHLLKVLTLYWMFVEKWPLIFGTSTNLDTAGETWQESVDMALDTPALNRKLPPGPRRGVRLANGQQTLRTVDRCRYKIGAVNRKGGRGFRIDRLVGDELREHRTWTGYMAAYGAMNARPHGQAWFITNQGDARSVVLTSLRTNALAFLADGVGDERLGIFEWSAPPGTHPMDMDGWAAANPQLGRRVDHDTIRGLAVRVAKPGADLEELAGFLTEYLCMPVAQLDPALDVGAWQARCLEPGTLEGLRVSLCMDLSPDGLHATVAAAAVLEDGRVRVETIASTEGVDAVEKLRALLPGLVAAVRPVSVGWFPDGPAAALDAEMRDRRKAGRRGWPPRGVKVAELRTESSAVCMGFALAVANGRIAHSGQRDLDVQAEQAEKLYTGDRWVFTRRGAGHVDAVYAVAGAAHLARTAPLRRKVSSTVHVAGDQ